MKVEYLITIKKDNGFCADTKQFINLLMSSENISINVNEKKIEFEGKFFYYKLQNNDIGNEYSCCYHMTIEHDDNLQDDIIDKMNDLLKNIRSIIIRVDGRIEILWDDIGFHYSKLAYPIIYNIENLMRKLLTKFMLVNVGIDWEKDSMPKKISNQKDKYEKRERGENQGYLYSTDFKDLTIFLFDDYAKQFDSNVLLRIIKDKESIETKAFEEYIPKSNWERYFKGKVGGEAKQLEKDWGTLHELRCKVAHNNFLSKSEFSEVDRLTKKIEPILRDAIEKLDTIKVETDSKEELFENIAVSKNELVGSFINAWNDLGSYLIWLYPDNRQLPFIIIAQKLRELEKLDEENYKIIRALQYYRNRLVHGTAEIQSEELEKQIILCKKTRENIEKIQNSI